MILNRYDIAFFSQKVVRKFQDLASGASSTKMKTITKTEPKSRVSENMENVPKKGGGSENPNLPKLT